MAETEDKRLQDNEKVDPLVQKEINVPKDEIHYKQERYDGNRENKRANVISGDVAFESQNERSFVEGGSFIV